MEKITVPQIKLSLLKQNNIFPHFSKAKRSKTLCSHPTQRFPQHRHTQTGQKQTQLTFLSKQPTSAPCPNSLKNFFLKTNKGKNIPLLITLVCSKQHKIAKTIYIVEEYDCEVKFLRRLRGRAAEFSTEGTGGWYRLSSNCEDI